MADALSRPPTSTPTLISAVSPPSVVDLNVLAEQQTTCPSNRDLSLSSSLSIKQVSVDGVTVYCDFSTGTPRPLVPQSCRRGIFDAYRNIAYPGVRTTRRLVSSRFIWQGLSTYIRAWARSCLDSKKRENKPSYQDTGATNSGTCPTFQPHPCGSSGPFASPSEQDKPFVMPLLILLMIGISGTKSRPKALTPQHLSLGDLSLKTAHFFKHSLDVMFCT